MVCLLQNMWRLQHFLLVSNHLLSIKGMLIGQTSCRISYPMRDIYSIRKNIDTYKWKVRNGKILMRITMFSIALLEHLSSILAFHIVYMSNTADVLQEAGTAYPLQTNTWVHPRFLVVSVLLTFLVVCVVLQCVFTFLVPCYDVRNDFCIKLCSVRLYLLLLFVRGLMSY